MSINFTPIWIKLKLHGLLKNKLFDLRKAFKSDLFRASNFSIKSTHLFFDYSRQLVSTTTMKLLLDLADKAGLKQKINDMFSGKKINITEDRSVLHIALRDFSSSPIIVDGKDVKKDVFDVLAKIKKYSNEVLNGERKGITGKKLTNIISIGIGGSYLGPEYLATACKAFAIKGMNLKFIANVDGTDFAQAVDGLNAEESLFIIVSKTFTTAETMMNANSAKKWMVEKLGNSPDVIKKHFIAVSTAKEKVKAFGIDPDNMFEFWNWVGGRFSATSAVGGVPLSLYLGYDNFEQILKGAHWMDQHYLKEPFLNNIPVTAALLDIYNINFLNKNIRVILPYSQALSKYAPHSQQTEMESNGKRIDLMGRKTKFHTGETVFGEPGTNGQHSFYQLIHQSAVKDIYCDFIAHIKPQYNVGNRSVNEVDHHQELLSNFIAQPDALAFGKTKKELKKEGVPKKLIPHKIFDGNRPSCSILLEELNPFTLGILLAFLEHRVATKGFIWGINSFDQWGVELGKKLGVQSRQEFLNANKDNNYRLQDKFNQSSDRILNAIIEGNLPK